jgi:hypothetical protein
MTNVPSPRRVRNATPPPKTRTLRLSRPVHGKFALLLTIHRTECGYYLEPQAADFGLLFRLEKFSTCQVEGEDSEYTVRLDMQKGFHRCTCKGNHYRQHCKHVDALLLLVKQGRIPADQVETMELTALPPTPEPVAVPQPPPQEAKVNRCFECGCIIPPRTMYCEKHDWL